MGAADGKRLWAEWLFDGEHWLKGVGLQIGSDGRLLAMDDDAPGPDADRHACVIPGLVNAHVHLDLPRLTTRPPGGFVDWIRAVIRERVSLDAEETETLILENLRGLIDTGCACIADVDTTGLTQGAMSILGVGGRSYRELIGFDLDEEAAEALLTSLSLDSGVGLSPHAPYSVSAELFEAARRTGRPLMIHCSETSEELEFLQHGAGPFRDLLEFVGRWSGAFEAPGCSAVAWLDRLGCLGPDTLLVHVQEMVPGDLEILGRARSPVVICPGSIHYFGREAPRVQEMWEAGLTLALGTDSLASNEELDLFGEMQRLHTLVPGLDPLHILRMATSMGGRALGIPHAGRIEPGIRFDALAFRQTPEGSGPGALSEWICAARPRPDARFLGGRDGCRGEHGTNPAL